MLTSAHWPDADQRELCLDEQPDCLDVFADFLKSVVANYVTRRQRLA